MIESSWFPSTLRISVRILATRSDMLKTGERTIAPAPRRELARPRTSAVENTRIIEP